MTKSTDGRRLDAATQAQMRRTVVKAVRAGMRQTEAAPTFGVSLRAVNKWMAIGKQGGLRALAANRRGRSARGGSAHRRRRRSDNASLMRCRIN